ncbi:MAG: hypothetical protein HY096_14440 [Nitrospinae bacterium]|nr:hypothetical protein [Nitrospinota bacterium]
MIIIPKSRYRKLDKWFLRSTELALNGFKHHMEVMRDASLGGWHGCQPRMSERLMLLTHASFYLCFREIFWV